jgi:predicted acetylornithine/succinylornithine family transaminase
MQTTVDQGTGLTAELRALAESHLLNNYGTRKIAFIRGEGATLWDAEGKEYLDFFAGIAVCNLGHCHPAVTRAVTAQAAKLVHVSNLYLIEPQVRLAALLAAHSFAPRWFFCNSGTEANEAAIKMARRHWRHLGQDRPGIVSMQQSFHGRTMGALSATGQAKIHDGVAPLLPGFQYVPFNDLAALEAAIGPDTGAVMIEPVQGEGGVRPADPAYLREVRALCNARHLLLIFDEVQCGMGRTGTLFAHEGYGVVPDIIVLAKGLGNGVPIGALGCSEAVAPAFAPGAHGCTFGGNPLSAAAALAVLETLLEGDLMDHARRVGEQFQKRLRAVAADHPGIVEVRGRGLMIGVECAQPVAPLLERLLEAGIVCGPAGPNVVRFLPPLIVTTDQVERVAGVFAATLGELGW